MLLHEVPFLFACDVGLADARRRYMLRFEKAISRPPPLLLVVTAPIVQAERRLCETIHTTERCALLRAKRRLPTTERLCRVTHKTTSPHTLGSFVRCSAPECTPSRSSCRSPCLFPARPCSQSCGRKTAARRSKTNGLKNGEEAGGGGGGSDQLDFLPSDV